MHNDDKFYTTSCHFIKELMTKHTPMNLLEEIVYPLLKLLNPHDIDRNLINLVVLEKPNHNYSEYYPLAYHILNNHADFYNDKPKELAAFAWEIASKLGCNDGTDELFETVLPKLGKFINYDYLEDVKNCSGASSLAHEIFYNKNSKSKIIPQMLELGTNFIGPSNNYNSALDRHFLNWGDDLKLGENELNDDLIETIKVFLMDKKIKDIYLEHLKKYPNIEELGIVQSIALKLELENKIHTTNKHKNIKKI